MTSKFTGQQLDEEAGLYYYGSRYYDPAIGRFVSADSIVPNAFDGQSHNAYSYVLNNPVRYVDPTGHRANDASDRSGGVETEGADGGKTQVPTK